MTWYARFLYYDEKNYKKALYYLSLAEKKDDLLALKFLFELYMQGLACPIDKQKAFAYLNRAIELGCNDSLALLGLQIYLGSTIDNKKDILKGIELIKEAQKKGSDKAKDYLLSIHNEILQEEITEQEKKLKQRPIKSIRTIGRNDPCFCGSGKKYKNYCLQSK